MTEQEYLEHHQFNSVTGTHAGVGSVSTLVLAQNTSRKWASVINNSDTPMVLNLGSAATAGEGIRLGTAGGERKFEISWLNLYTGAINKIHEETGTKQVTVAEGW